ncbi:MAG: cytidine/deoxycytidylate deaminase family protein [bacterium]
MSNISEDRLNDQVSEARPGWDEYFVSITRLVASRSTCLRRSVGAIIVKDRRILTTGYNGAPSGLPHCRETGCLREERGVPSGERAEICRGLHAEQNAIIQAARHGVCIEGSSLYCTNQPCLICAKMLINAGIVEIVYEDGYPDPLAEKMLEEAQVRVRRYEGGGR